MFPGTIAGLAGVTPIEVRPISFPVPLSATMLGLVMAESSIVSVPCCCPTMPGVNVIPSLQVPPGATPEPQVLLATEKPVLATMDENSSSELR